MKRAVFITAILLLFVAGLMLLLYPGVSNWLAERNHSKAIQEYRAGVSEALAPALREEREKAALYNQSLARTDGYVPMNPEDMDTADDYYATLNRRGIMGYLSVPRINVSLPIYHGTGADVLLKGVGHMANTPLPIGEPGNHSVLTGHSGLPSAKLLNDLERLKVGDIFYLYVLDETLAYMVDNISVIEPDNAGFLMTSRDRDYVSLVTCTPYGINSHRLVVRGSRIPYIEGTGEISLDAAPRGSEPWIYAAAVFTLFILIAIACIKKRHMALDPEKILLRLLAALLFISGICMLAYPPISQYGFQKRARQINAGYLERMRRMADIRAGDVTNGENEPEYSVADFFYEQMIRYNERLFEERQTGLSDSDSYREADTALKEFGYCEDMIGYIVISKMNVELPIYLGANKENMKKGASHLTNTSLPVGGANTNAVIAAHRGYGALPMFRDIDRLKAGDEVMIVNLREALSYRVTGIRIIDPADRESILIQPGRDMITLLTCHPYGYDHMRYVVYCERKG